MPEAAWREKSQLICEALRELSCVRSASSVAVFWPMEQRREVDLRPLARWLWQRGASVCLPYMSAQHESFKQVASETELAAAAAGFLQPLATHADCVPEVIVVPALGVTTGGRRLGYGAGFYDRALTMLPDAVSVVVCFDAQVLDYLPLEPHDVSCAWVVTESRVLAADEP